MFLSSIGNTLLCDSAKQALSAVLIDPALKRQQEESKKTGEGSQEDRNIVSSVLGSVKVDERTVDLDSDGEGMEDFDVE